MAELLKDKINDHLSERSKDTNDALKKFLVEKVLDDSKEENKKLKEEIMSDVDLDEKLESALNKEHLTNFLTKMKDELTSSGYTEAYKTRGKALTFGVQSALSLMGFDIGGAEIDGYYGKNTVKAVKQFQAWKGINVDGSAGQETINTILTAGLDTKITEEEKTKLDITTTPKKNKQEVGKDFYTTHTEFTEKDFGGVKNKVYKVEKFEDIPTNIAKDTVIDFGAYYLFSNGAVYDYGTDGKALIRRGTRAELDETGKWKDAAKEPVKETEKAPVNVEKEDTEAELPKVQYDLVKKQILDKATSPKFYEDKTSGVKGNPYLSLKTNTNPARVTSLNVALYLDGDGVVDTKKFLADAKSATDKLAADETADKNYKAALDKEISVLRDKSYGLVELFTKEEIAAMPKKTKIGYTSFFSMFDNTGGAKIDIAGSSYTKFTDVTKSTIQIALDFDDDKDTQKLDKFDATNKNEFPVKDKENGIFDDAGKLREENLKKALKTIAKRIVEDPANGFINA